MHFEGGSESKAGSQRSPIVRPLTSSPSALATPSQLGRQFRGAAYESPLQYRQGLARGARTNTMAAPKPQQAQVQRRASSTVSQHHHTPRQPLQNIFTQKVAESMMFTTSPSLDKRRGGPAGDTGIPNAHDTLSSASTRRTSVVQFSGGGGTQETMTTPPPQQQQGNTGAYPNSDWPTRNAAASGALLNYQQRRRSTSNARAPFFINSLKLDAKVVPSQLDEFRMERRRKSGGKKVGAKRRRHEEASGDDKNGDLPRVRVRMELSVHVLYRGEQQINLLAVADPVESRPLLGIRNTSPQVKLRWPEIEHAECTATGIRDYAESTVSSATSPITSPILQSTQPLNVELAPVDQTLLRPGSASRNGQHSHKECATLRHSPVFHASRISPYPPPPPSILSNDDAASNRDGSQTGHDLDLSAHYQYHTLSSYTRARARATERSALYGGDTEPQDGSSSTAQMGKTLRRTTSFGDDAAFKPVARLVGGIGGSAGWNRPASALDNRTMLHSTMRPGSARLRKDSVVSMYTPIQNRAASPQRREHRHSSALECETAPFDLRLGSPESVVFDTDALSGMFVARVSEPRRYRIVVWFSAPADSLSLPLVNEALCSEGTGADTKSDDPRMSVFGWETSSVTIRGIPRALHTRVRVRLPHRRVLLGDDECDPIMLEFRKRQRSSSSSSSSSKRVLHVDMASAPSPLRMAGLSRTTRAELDEAMLFSPSPGSEFSSGVYGCFYRVQMTSPARIDPVSSRAIDARAASASASGKSVARDFDVFLSPGSRPIGTMRAAGDSDGYRVEQPAGWLVSEDSDAVESDSPRHSSEDGSTDGMDAMLDKKIQRFIDENEQNCEALSESKIHIDDLGSPIPGGSRHLRMGSVDCMSDGRRSAEGLHGWQAFAVGQMRAEGFDYTKTELTVFKLKSVDEITLTWFPRLVQHCHEPRGYLPGPAEEALAVYDEPVRDDVSEKHHEQKTTQETNGVELHDQADVPELPEQSANGSELQAVPKSSVNGAQTHITRFGLETIASAESTPNNTIHANTFPAIAGTLAEINGHSSSSSSSSSSSNEYDETLTNKELAHRLSHIDSALLSVLRPSSTGKVIVSSHTTDARIYPDDVLLTTDATLCLEAHADYDDEDVTLKWPGFVDLEISPVLLALPVFGAAGSGHKISHAALYPVSVTADVADYKGDQMRWTTGTQCTDRSTGLDARPIDREFVRLWIPEHLDTRARITLDICLAVDHRFSARGMFLSSCVFVGVTQSVISVRGQAPDAAEEGHRQFGVTNYANLWVSTAVADGSTKVPSELAELANERRVFCVSREQLSPVTGLYLNTLKNHVAPVACPTAVCYYVEANQYTSKRVAITVRMECSLASLLPWYTSDAVSDGRSACTIALALCIPSSKWTVNGADLVTNARGRTPAPMISADDDNTVVFLPVRPIRTSAQIKRRDWAKEDSEVGFDTVCCVFSADFDCPTLPGDGGATTTELPAPIFDPTQVALSLAAKQHKMEFARASKGLLEPTRVTVSLPPGTTASLAGDDSGTVCYTIAVEDKEYEGLPLVNHHVTLDSASAAIALRLCLPEPKASPTKSPRVGPHERKRSEARVFENPLESLPSPESFAVAGRSTSPLFSPDLDNIVPVTQSTVSAPLPDSRGHPPALATESDPLLGNSHRSDAESSTATLWTGRMFFYAALGVLCAIGAMLSAVLYLEIPIADIDMRDWLRDATPASGNWFASSSSGSSGQEAVRNAGGEFSVYMEPNLEEHSADLALDESRYTHEDGMDLSEPVIIVGSADERHQGQQYDDDSESDSPYQQSSDDDSGSENEQQQQKSMEENPHAVQRVYADSSSDSWIHTLLDPIIGFIQSLLGSSSRKQAKLPEIG